MACICSVMGISTPRARASPTAAVVVKIPSATMPCIPARISGNLSSAAQFDAHATIAGESAGAGQHQIAQARKASHSFGFAATGHHQPSHLRQTARDQGRNGIVSQAQARTDAGGDGDDVFQRSAEFDADGVVIGVNAKAGIAEFMLHAARQFSVLGRYGNRSRVSPRRFQRKRWATERADARSERYRIFQNMAITSVMRSRVSFFESFGRAHDQRFRRQSGPHPFEQAAAILRRHHADHDVGALKRFFQIVAGFTSRNRRPGRNFSFTR